MTYEVWATTEKGEGHVQQIIEVENIEDVRILCGMFDKDTMITITKKLKSREND